MRGLDLHKRAFFPSLLPLPSKKRLRNTFKTTSFSGIVPRTGIELMLKTITGIDFQRFLHYLRYNRGTKLLRKKSLRVFEEILPSILLLVVLFYRIVLQIVPEPYFQNILKYKNISM